MSAVSEQHLAINGNGALRRTISENEPVNGNNGICHQNPTTDDEWSRASSEEHSDYGAEKQSMDDLDKKAREFLIERLDPVADFYLLNFTNTEKCAFPQVQRTTNIVRRQCRCPNGKCEKLKIKKVGEGKYTIGGRNVFIRVSIDLFCYTLESLYFLFAENLLRNRLLNSFFYVHYSFFLITFTFLYPADFMYSFVIFKATSQ